MISRLSVFGQKASLVVLAGGAFVAPDVALAHARWFAPGTMVPSNTMLVPRTANSNLKSFPCGGVARTAQSAVLYKGTTVKLKFEETIEHPGKYVIYFSQANDANFTLLMDNIPDIAQPLAVQNGVTVPRVYEVDVPVPNVDCAACTLQLVQVMTGSATLYHSCADIRIQAAPVGPVPSPSPAPVVTPSAPGGNPPVPAGTPAVGAPGGAPMNPTVPSSTTSPVVPPGTKIDTSPMGTVKDECN